MENQYVYETVSEAMNDLYKRGYTTDFQIHSEKECIICNNHLTQLSPEEFEIDETYRFEGNTDPGDEMIVFAISSLKHNIKGIIVNAYGMYSDSTTSKIVERLANHIKTKNPQKRAEYLKPLSREHHYGLLLCWKIKTGFSKGVSLNRMERYTHWFYNNLLKPHFEIEEKYIFPILGNENSKVIQALAEHKHLRSLFSETNLSENLLNQIQIDLEKHIRFEERVLFNDIQDKATETQIEAIKYLHSIEKFKDNTTDPFWE
jgi:iron-sulfur cluster repair protein YtfE (RIC family)